MYTRKQCSYILRITLTIPLTMLQIRTVPSPFVYLVTIIKEVTIR